MAQSCYKGGESSQLNIERLIYFRSFKGVKTFLPKLNWRTLVNCAIFADSLEIFGFQNGEGVFRLLVWFRHGSVFSSTNSPDMLPKLKHFFSGDIPLKHLSENTKCNVFRAHICCSYSFMI